MPAPTAAPPSQRENIHSAAGQPSAVVPAAVLRRVMENITVTGPSILNDAPWSGEVWQARRSTGAARDVLAELTYYQESSGHTLHVTDLRSRRAGFGAVLLLRALQAHPEVTTLAAGNDVSRDGTRLLNRLVDRGILRVVPGSQRRWIVERARWRELYDVLDQADALSVPPAGGEARPGTTAQVEGAVRSVREGEDDP